MPPLRVPSAGSKDDDRRKATEADLQRAADFAKLGRSVAMDMDAHDKDRNRSLDFREFSRMVREREMAIQTEEALRKRFKAMDLDGSGEISMTEFIKFALKDAYQRSGARVVELLKEWDEDGNGEIEVAEFAKLVRVLGFDALESEVQEVFDELDGNKSGSLELRELKTKLSERVIEEAAEGDKDYGTLQRHELRQLNWREGAMAAEAKIAAQVQAVAAAAPVAAEPGALGAMTAKQMAKQLRIALGDEEGLERVMDLFRVWDTDGDGMITKKEFRRAVATLGFAEVDKKQIDALFDRLDKDKTGTIEYREVNQFLGRQALRPPGSPGSPASSPVSPQRPRGSSHEAGPAARLLRHTALSVENDVPLIEQLTAALATNWGRVTDLFKEWDADGSGTVSPKEFRQAMEAIGLGEHPEAIRYLFESIDIDNSGEVALDELERAVRPSSVRAAKGELHIGFRPSKAQRALLAPGPLHAVKVGTAAHRAQAAMVKAEAEAIEAAARAPRPPPTAAPLFPSHSPRVLERHERPVSTPRPSTGQSTPRAPLSDTEWFASVREGAPPSPRDSAMAQAMEELHARREWRRQEQLAAEEAARQAEAMRAHAMERQAQARAATERGRARGAVPSASFVGVPPSTAPAPSSAPAGAAAAGAAGSAGGGAQILDLEAQILDLEAEIERLPGEEEERFESGMRNNAMEFLDADEDDSGALDFDEFCAMTRKREADDLQRGDHSEISLKELRRRFNEIDVNRSGSIDRSEFIRFSLLDALSRSRKRVLDLLIEWDDSGDRLVDKLEFRRALRALGFGFCSDHDIDAVFGSLDEDGSGQLDYRELVNALRPSTVAQNKFKLRRNAGGRKGNFVGKFTLSATSEMSVVRQLKAAMMANRARVLDLFREWDEDGDGLVDRAEFRKAVRALGFSAARADVDDLFAEFDRDGSGVIEYSELSKLLREQPTGLAPNRPASRERPEARGGSAPAAPGGASASGGGQSAPPATLWLPREAGLGAQRAGSAQRAVALHPRPQPSVQPSARSPRLLAAAGLLPRGEAAGGDSSVYAAMGSSVYAAGTPTPAVYKLVVSGQLPPTYWVGGSSQRGVAGHATLRPGLGAREAASRYAHERYAAALATQSAEMEAFDADEMAFERRLTKLSQMMASQQAADGYPCHDRHGKRLRAHPPPPRIAEPAYARGGRIAAGAAAGPPAADAAAADAAAAELARLTAEAHVGRDWAEARAVFEEGMRTNALEYIAADLDESGLLDFDEFCKMVRELEQGEFTMAELRRRFEELDVNKNGRIDRHEFIQFSLFESLGRSAGRVVDLFISMDRDRNNAVDKKEFRKAIRALGFSPDFYLDRDVDAVFAALDEDGSGTMDMKELTRKLRPGTIAANKFRLRKKTQGARGQVFGAHVKLDMSSGEPPLEQLHRLLCADRVRIIDLFRSWDADGNGQVDRHEFTRAIQVLGFDAPVQLAHELFASWDRDGSGVLEFKELNKVLKHGGVARGGAPTATQSGGTSASAKVAPKTAAVGEALETLRASFEARSAQLKLSSGRLNAISAEARDKRERAVKGHAALLQRQLVDALRGPNVLTKVPAVSARGPPKAALPALDGYLLRPESARTAPPVGMLLRPGAPLTAR